MYSDQNSYAPLNISFKSGPAVKIPFFVNKKELADVEGPTAHCESLDEAGDSLVLCRESLPCKVDH